MAYASSGRTASLVAKYRPASPILTLVVPAAAAAGAAGLRDALTLARQCLLVRGAYDALGQEGTADLGQAPSRPLAI